MNNTNQKVKNMNKINNTKSRINAFISPMNYNKIDELMTNSALGSRKLSKGEILDLALTHFFIGLDCGESLENIAINHYEALADVKEGGI